MLLAMAALAACSRPVPFEPAQGAVRYQYAPTRQVQTFPDAVHTADDAATPTGRRVAFQDQAREQLIASMPEGFDLVPALEDLDGFGTAGGISLFFDGPIDPDSFEAAAHLWQLGDDPMELPWEVEWHDEGTYAVVHPWVPLREATPHGFVVDGLLDATGAPVSPSRSLHDLVHAQSEAEALIAVEPQWAELLATAGVSAESVAAGTVWTTQSVTLHDEGVLAALSLQPPSLVPDGADCVDEGTVMRCGLVLQGAADLLGADRHLDVPYGSDPVIERRYDLSVDVYLPKDGGGPWPVMLFGHGLSGDRGEGSGASRRLFAPNGYATVAIDAPAHGDHPTTTTSADLYWVFEFFGLSAASGSFDVRTLRDAWRQAAWDKLQLARAMHGASIDVDGDGQPDLDGSEVSYSGHSLGGTMGPQLLALDPDIHAADLSVPGGRVADIVQHGQIFSPLVVGLAPPGTTEAEIASFFVLLQAGIERGDPINYAPQVLNGDRDLLVTMVLDDQIMPNRTTRALARSLGVEHAPPRHQEFGLVELGALPVSGNLDGQTAVFFEYDQELDGEQWVPAVHEHAHSNAIAVEQVGHFWQTWQAQGVGEVIDPYVELGR